MMTKNTASKLKLILSMTVFGTLGLFVRNIPVSSGELALYRAVLAAGLIGVFLGVTGQKIPVKKLGRDLMVLLLSGVVITTTKVYFKDKK